MHTDQSPCNTLVSSAPVYAMQLVSSAPVYAMQHNIIVKYGKESSPIM